MKKTLYFFSNGTLKRKDNTLFYETEDGKRRFFPIEDIREILAFGEINFNKALIDLLSQKEIILHYYNYYGYYMGSFYPREHINSGSVILKQAEMYLDEVKRLTLAKKFVFGAAGNMRQVIKYYIHHGKALSGILECLDGYIAAIEKQTDIPSLMAVEGNIHAIYYQAFDTIIGNKDFVFQERTRRPPKNYLNTLISFGNTLAYATCLCEIYKTHLDPRIGYLHSTNSRRFSLNLDVAEIFKPILVDRIIFSCIAKKSISKKDFANNAKGILMKEDGKKKFIEAWNKKMETTFHHRESGKDIPYQRLIRLELYKIEKHIRGEREYEPFLAKW
jgi:CRISPR-associated protein Cas1